MAVVFEEALKKNIAKEPSGVYILFGEDSFLKKSYADKIAKKIAKMLDGTYEDRFVEFEDTEDIPDFI